MIDTKAIDRPTTDSHFFAESVQAIVPTGEKAAGEAQERLSTSSYLALRRISCEYHEGMLVLRGKLPSFYLKQLAQEIVRQIEGVGVIVNAVEVGD